MIKMSVSKVITKKEVDEVLKTEISKSQKIIKLFEGGLDVKEISILMGIRYNFSYNVISNYIRMNDVKGVVKEEKENKKSEIIKLYKEGEYEDLFSKIALNSSEIFEMIKKKRERRNQKVMFL